MTRKVIAAMRISSFFYSIKQGIKNIWRNKMFSVASIATMCACIFLFGLFYSIVENFQSMVKEAEEGVAISVFFNEGISQEQIDEIGNKIGKRVEVASYEFISADEAWERCKETYFGGSEEAAEGFAENPLANSASYEIYMKDVSMQDALVTYLESLDGVREVHHSAVVANTLSDFNKLIAYVSGGIILILLAVAIFLISNTVTVGISVRRRRDCDYEADWSYGFFCAGTICSRGCADWASGFCIATDSALLHVWQDYSICSGQIQLFR